MATIDGALADLERAGYDYRITRRSTHDRAAVLDIEVRLPGALQAPRIALHHAAAAADTAGLAAALAEIGAVDRAARSGEP